MLIEGIIEDIIFRNDENGYTVAVVSHIESGVDQYLTAVGILPEVKTGQSLKLEGKYINTKYGEQFSFQKAEIIYPNSASGIKKYLSSGLIRGVGPVTSNAIVDKFGSDTLTIIEFSPEKLASIKGISLKKAYQINESFNSIKNMQDTVLFLQKYDITTNMSIKIYNIYKEKTIETIKANPYRLVEDVNGIGFLTADKIAQVMGIESNSAFRIRAGIIHVLSENSEKNGNTYILKDDLIKNLCSLLLLNKDINNDIINEVLQNMGFDKVISMFRNKSGREIVMLTNLYFTESSVAQKLTKLSYLAKNDNINCKPLIESFETINKIKFDENQIKAIESSINNGVNIITGGPGTGKTTIIKCIINILEQEKYRVLLLAPTGRASKRLSESTGKEAKTIHRGLEINFKSDNKMFVYNEQNPLNCDAIIVDEVSMVDVILMNSLLKAIPKDCKLILVGDKDQLPSVGAGNVLGDILNSGIINVSYLNKIFRQDEKSLIVSNAHLINEGKFPIIDNTSKDFFFESHDEPEEIRDSIITLITKRLPNFTNTEPNKIQILCPLKAGASGVQNLNTCLQEKINPAIRGKNEIVIGKNIFREGDKVMQTSNNYELTWVKQSGFLKEEGSGVFNGDIGYIQKIYPGSDETEILFEDGRICRYQKTDLSELSLAYAITIHKSQGSEFDVVVIPIISGPSLILTRNLIYTAITRAKKLVVLVGNKKNLQRMVSNSYTAERLTMLKDFLVEADNKFKLLYG